MSGGNHRGGGERGVRGAFDGKKEKGDVRGG